MIRVRFAPSPTGYLHLGGLRSALINYMFSKKYGNDKGKFVIRIEDTDQTRLKRDSIKDLLDSLSWTGLKADEGPLIGGEYGPYIQSERLSLYRQYAEELIHNNKAYRCFCCEQELRQIKLDFKNQGRKYLYDKRCLRLSQQEINSYLSKNSSYCIRLKNKYSNFMGRNNDLNYQFNDLIFKNSNIDISKFDDFIILKRDMFPTYHFANVIDDHGMKISHVLRGEEWLNSIQMHLLVYEALNWQPPKFGHLPLIYDNNGLKISKRHGDQYCIYKLKEAGYFPDSILTFLYNIGYNSFNNIKEPVDLQELTNQFDINRISKGNPHLDTKKLDYYNQKQILNIQKISSSYQNSIKYLNKLINFSFKDCAFDQTVLTTKYSEEIFELVKGRIHKLNDIVNFVPYMFTEPIVYNIDDIKALVNQNNELEKLLKLIADHLVKTPFEKPHLDCFFKNVKESLNISGPITNKSIIHNIRFAITGQFQGPPLINIMLILQKSKVIDRLTHFNETMVQNTRKIMNALENQ